MIFPFPKTIFEWGKIIIKVAKTIFPLPPNSFEA